MADMSDMFNKLKNMVEQFTGPSQTEKTEDALAKETDEFKVKLLKIELLINQLHDVQIMQAKGLNDLKNEYVALKTDVEKRYNLQTQGTSSTPSKEQQPQIKPDEPGQNDQNNNS